jgi:hypothetical protein
VKRRHERLLRRAREERTMKREPSSRSSGETTVADGSRK